MKKGNLGSLISSPSSSSTISTATKINSKISMDIIKQRIETLVKTIDKKSQFSLQIKLPKFDIDHDNLRVESSFGNTTRSTSAIWQDEDFNNHQSEKKDNSPSSENDLDFQSDRYDSTYGTSSSSSNSSLHIYLQDSSPLLTNQFNRRHTYTPSLNNHRTRGLRRRTTALPIQSSILHKEKLSNEYPSFFYRTNSTPSFIT